MSRPGSGADSVRELFAPPLGKSEAAFMYLGYSGVLLRTIGGTMAFDVADLLKGEEIRALKRLDLLIFTHGHGDHYRPREALDIFEATGAHTVAEPTLAEDLEGSIPPDKLTCAVPGKTYTVDGFRVGTIAGVHNGPINLYRVEVGELSVFHGGDSGYVPVSDHRADLAFIPTGSPSPTATPEAAFRMTLELKPMVAVAIHGSAAQIGEFQRKVQEKMPETTTIIPEVYMPKRVSLKREA